MTSASGFTTRQVVAEQSLRVLVDLADSTGNQVFVSTDVEHLVNAVEQDMVLKSSLRSVQGAVLSAVGWLHALRILTVQNGLAIFRTAMQIDRDPDWPKLGDQEAQQATSALAAHQEQKVLRVHVMDAWARHMLEDPEVGEAFRADWFASSIQEFTQKWFPGQKQQIARPTTPESYDAIVTSLNDEAQEKIVTRDIRRNHLVLAGPGSGKTRILVHRVAWLVRRQRIRPRQILVVCYTRANALELRRRLFELVGRDARFVTIQTIHALAISNGRDPPDRIGWRPDPRDPVCPWPRRCCAAKRWKKQSRRGSAMRCCVDSTISSSTSIRTSTRRSTSCYRRSQDAPWRAISASCACSPWATTIRRSMRGTRASSDFIRSFEEDYHATRFVVPHGYRNPKAVLDMAQALVKPLPNRTKGGDLVNRGPRTHWRSRRRPVDGGAHPELRGRLLWHRSASVQDAAGRLMETVGRWIGDGVAPALIGVLARSRPTGLHRLRSAAEKAGIPFQWTLPGDSSLPMGRIREVASLSDWIHTQGGQEERIGAASVMEQIRQLAEGPWRDSLQGLAGAFRGSQPDTVAVALRAGQLGAARAPGPADWKGRASWHDAQRQGP